MSVFVVLSCKCVCHFCNKELLYFFCRSASLDHVNKLLREQLDRATAANQSLSAEVAKLSARRDEFDVKEADFKTEEQVDRCDPAKNNTQLESVLSVYSHSLY